MAIWTCWSPSEHPDWAPMLAEMQKQSQRMTQLVEDLLTLSRLEAQESPPDENVAMAPMLATLRREAEALSQRRHTIVVQDEAGVDLAGSTRSYTAQLSNLVSNAVRYTPRGHALTVRSAREGDGAVLSGPRHRLRHPVLRTCRAYTERFYRVSTSRSRRAVAPAWGCPSSNTYSTCTRPGWDIESEVGQGSTFSVHFDPERVNRAWTLPYPRPDGSDPHERLPRRRPPPRSPPADLLRRPALYLNRELSQLDFNFRGTGPGAGLRPCRVLERLRFLCISCTNLDEFFEIRAATVRHALDFGLPPGAGNGMSPATVLNRIHDRAAELVDAQYKCWNEVLRPGLAEAGVRVFGRDSWNARQTRWLRAYFRNEIMPVLSPLGLDPAHPFPKILNKSLNIVVVLKGQGRVRPRRPPRHRARAALAAAHHPHARACVRRRERLRAAVLGAVGVRRRVCSRHGGQGLLPVPRDPQLPRSSWTKRKWRTWRWRCATNWSGAATGPAVRLEIAHDCPEPIVRTLLQNFALPDNAVYPINGPVNLNRVIQVYDLVQRPDLKYPPSRRARCADRPTPHLQVADGDVLLHHPFDRSAGARTDQQAAVGSGGAGDQADPVPHRQGLGPSSTR